MGGVETEPLLNRTFLVTFRKGSEVEVLRNPERIGCNQKKDEIAFFAELDALDLVLPIDFL